MAYCETKEKRDLFVKYETLIFKIRLISAKKMNFDLTVLLDQFRKDIMFEKVGPDELNALMNDPYIKEYLTNKISKETLDKSPEYIKVNRLHS